MTKKIEKIKEKILPILKKNDVIRASIFGSFARGEEKEGSDIDILVELRKDKSLLDLIHLKNELEDLLKQKVDLLTYGGVNPRLEKYIYRDEIKIYGKGQFLESINKIEKYVAEINEQNFSENFLVIDAVVRNLEIIGEAARNLEDNFKIANSHIAWRDITDFRNVLIHEYFGVNKDLVWQVIKKDIPALKKEIEILLK